MEDELPPLRRLAWDPVTDSFNHRSRKRERSSPPPSSELALFSSDDDPSADNYTQERRKKKYRGPWYQQRLADNEALEEKDATPKRLFTRNFDSGVFMGSDSTDIDESMEDLEFQESQTTPRQPRFQAQIHRSIPSAEDFAREQIQICLDEGDETIDLSSRNLTSLSNSTIRPLATFTRIAEGGFSQLKPSLKVFLASNELRSLPEELCKLNTLSVLSLRNNSFEELPPAISNLHNLKELNIANNRLRYLPFEILELFSTASRLEDIRLHPNPFFELKLPENGIDDEGSKAESGTFPASTRPRRGAICVVTPGRAVGRYDLNPAWTVTYKARTEVRYLESNGNFRQGPDFSGTSITPSKLASRYKEALQIVDDSDIPRPPEPSGIYHSKAPSLLEVALRACQQSPQLPNLAYLLHEDCPAYLFKLMDDLEAKKETGSSKCTICKRNFIVPRTEWIEWWEITKIVDHKTMAGIASAASPLRQKENERDAVERIIPLMRRGCSWLCVPAVKDGDREQPEQMNID